MGFRFRKRVRLFKGAWINLSKQGGYLSIGGHGLTTDVSKEGAARDRLGARPCSLQNEGADPAASIGRCSKQGLAPTINERFRCRLDP